MPLTQLELDDGATAYEVCGPSDGTPVVLVHGMSSPSVVWGSTVRALAAAGYRALTYDLYGRGASARPHVRYDLPLYVRQLEGVVRGIFGEQPVALVAYSWGAGLGAAWAARRRSAVTRLVLVAPGGLEISVAQRALSLPLFGALATKLGARRSLAADLRRGFVQPSLHADYVASVLAQLDVPGFEHAFLSTLRHVPSDLGAYYAALAAHDLPIGVLWGTLDAKVPIALAGRLGALIPAARVHPIEGAGHAAPVEHAAAFEAELLRVLAG